MRRLLLLLALSAFAAGCLGSQDNPTNVHDLRVLGMSFEPPELFAPVSLAELGDPKAQVALRMAWARPVTFTALIADPEGGGRKIEYELRACANRGDRTCATYLQDSKRFTDGDTGPGELVIGDFSPGATVLDDGDSLLQEAWDQDTYKGLGGILMPV
ncbi:MAG: hypothetical protein ACYC8T_34140, partial [Myxococcaceae bacterium]